MPSLRELQTAFASAVFAGGQPATDLLGWCAGDRRERGLEAYRRSVLANLAGAVQATYPVLEAIVGQDFLRAAARAYALERPSRSGDLNAYGSDVGDFLAAYAPAATLPYLPDVARLEWLVQSVYGAADPLPQELSRLARPAPADPGELRFVLDPAHAMLDSAWPLARIWEVNQPGYDGDFRVDFDQPQAVLIHRRPGGTVVEAIDPATHRFLQALAHGENLATAVATASGADSFDLQASLHRHIANGLLRQAF